LVRTHYSGVSIGTEFALIRNKLSWGPYPLCTGYMGVGTIEQVGENVSGFKVGDKVYYRHNRAGMTLPDGQAVSPVSGVHCSLTITSTEGTHGAALLPPGADEAAASMFVMPAVGLYGVDMANPRMGQSVVVYGVGLIGLGVVAACSHRGCVVVAVDIASDRLAIARKFGADYTIDSSSQDVRAELEKIAPGGADVVFEATGIPECLDPAIALCRSFGKFILQGNYGAAPISYHFLPPHTKRLTMFYPCDDGLVSCRRAVLKNMAMGVLPWQETITHRIEAPDAPALYERINKSRAKDVLGAVIYWE
jgi:L-iditol 2-dehydrogenase